MEGVFAILPHLYKAQIPIGSDPWDEITEKLYEQIVVEAIKHSLPIEDMQIFKFPTYEMNYPHYEGMSYIEAILRSQPEMENHLVFHSFEITNLNSLLTPRIKCISIDDNGSVFNANYQYFQANKVSYRCCVKTSGSTKTIDRLKITL